MSPFMRYLLYHRIKQEEHLFISMLSNIFTSKVLASDKLKKYGMGGLVGALGTSLLTFLFSVRVRNYSAKNHGQDNFECFQASALVCCLW